MKKSVQKSVRRVEIRRSEVHRSEVRRVEEFLESVFDVVPDVNVVTEVDSDAEWNVMQVVPARADHGGMDLLSAGLPIELTQALQQQGIHKLYQHQARVLELARNRQHAVVTTPTASGKSLCYQLPILEALYRNTDTKALLLFPTKALSRDQLAGFRRLLDAVPRSIAAEVFDGDTPPNVRRAVREEGDLVLTNPHMLHAGILPHHGRFAQLFRGLRYVVLDEMHTYRGVFGSHVAHVLRRLKRLANYYGSSPTFLFASATIGNPQELAELLIDDGVQRVDVSDAPRGQRTFVSVTPPVLHRQLGIRRSAIQQAVELFGRLLETELQCIFFHQTRNGVEILLKYFQDLAVQRHRDPQQIRGYRGGYLPGVRREIEQDLRSGAATTVVATNALELGMDIGGLDVSVLVGYPGSTAATLQRAGRAGRRNRSALSILIPRSLATDQYVVRHPDTLFRTKPESVAIDPSNTLIHANHLQCAAFELPLQGADLQSKQVEWIVDALARDSQVLTRIKDRVFYSAPSFPASNVSLNTGEIDNFVIIDAESRQPIAEIDRPSAVTMVHPEAIYNLEGEQYYIESMDYVGRRVSARKVDVNYYTEAEVEAEVKVLHDQSTRPFGDTTIWFGEVCVQKVTTMYKKIRFYPKETIGAGDIHLPAEELDTQSLAWVIPDAVLNEVDAHGEFRGAILNALGDLCRNVIPIRVRCGRSDLGVRAETRSAHFGSPTIFLWDEVPGGVGLTEAVALDFAAIAELMLEVVASCPCQASCPSCIGASLRDGQREKQVVCRLLENPTFPKPAVVAPPASDP